MFDPQHRAVVLLWARTHWRNDNSQPRDMDEILERTAVEIVALADSRLLWRCLCVFELGIIGGLVWLLTH